MPLVNSRILPSDWSAHHAPAAEGFLTGTAEIREPGTVGRWPDLDYKPGKLLWSGPASAQRIDRGAETTTAGETVDVQTYMLSFPLTDSTLPVLIAGESAHEVIFTHCPDDPQLTGQTFQITATQYGTTNWTRDTIAIIKHTGANSGQ